MLEFAHRSWILYIDFADFHHVSFNKGSNLRYFVNRLLNSSKRHSAIIEKYGTTLQEIRLAIQNLETPPYPLLFKILYIILATLFYFYIASIQFDADARAIFLKLCACLGYLVDVYLVRYLTYYIYFALFSILLLLVLTLWVTPSKMFCNWYRI